PHSAARAGPPEAVTRRLLLLRRSRPHHPDNRSERLEFVATIEFRRLERRHRAIEEERVLAAEAVAKEPRERVEGHRVVGDGEADCASLTCAHAVADLLRGA